MKSYGLNIPPELNEILCSLPNYVLLVDEKHRVLYANSAFTTQYGDPREEIVGGCCRKVIHGTDRPVEYCPLEESIKTHAAAEREIFDGASGRWLSFSVYPTGLLTAEGLRVFLHMIHDITQRKTAESELKESLGRMQKLTDAGIDAIALIVEKRDPYTAGHQRRVSRLVSVIAERMGLDENALDCIKKAGMLHDIGKVAIPIEILSKPGRISDDEYRMIKSHPQVGYDILKDVDFGQPIAEIILQHHERLDGSGYPKGLKDGEIMLEARIISVSDVIEAMISHRPYRPSLGIDSALNEIIKNRGTLYDPDVVDVCVRLFREENFEI